MLSSFLMSKGLSVLGLGLEHSSRLLKRIDGYFSQPHLETHGLTTSQFLSLMDSTKTVPDSSKSTSSTTHTPSFQRLIAISELESLYAIEMPLWSRCRMCG